MSNPSSICKRPALRYFGGKWTLAPWILSHFPPHQIYVEPFGGGASVLLRKPRSKTEIYNDLDGEIVNVFRVMQDRTRATELKRLIEMTPFAREEFDLAFEDCQEPIEQARRTLIKSFFGHGSVAIFHKCGLRTARASNQKSAAKDWQNYPKYIEAFIERLKEVIIENRDWRLIVRQFDSPRTLFYFDPPYVLSTLDTNKYYRHFLTDAAHEAFIETVKGLRGMVIISGYYSELYDGLLGEFRLESKKTTNNQGNTKTEFLWLSRNIEKNTPSLFEGIDSYSGREAIDI